MHRFLGRSSGRAGRRRVNHRTYTTWFPTYIELSHKQVAAILLGGIATAEVGFLVIRNEIRRLSEHSVLSTGVLPSSVWGVRPWWDRRIAQDPTDVVAAVCRGFLYYGSLEPDAALEVKEENPALAQHPTAPLPPKEEPLSDVAMLLDDVRTTGQDLDKHTEATLRLGWCRLLIETGRLDAAVKCAAPVLDSDPAVGEVEPWQRSRALSLTAAVRCLEGDLSSGLNLSQRALTENPANVEAAVWLSYILTRDGQITNGANVAERAVTMIQASIPWYWRIAGRLPSLVGVFPMDVLADAAESAVREGRNTVAETLWRLSYATHPRNNLAGAHLAHVIKGKDLLDNPTNGPYPTMMAEGMANCDSGTFEALAEFLQTPPPTSTAEVVQWEAEEQVRLMNFVRSPVGGYFSRLLEWWVEDPKISPSIIQAYLVRCLPGVPVNLIGVVAADAFERAGDVPRLQHFFTTMWTHSWGPDNCKEERDRQAAMYYRYGQALLRCGKPNDAKEELKRGVGYAPTSVPMLLSCATAFAKSGEPKWALPTLDTVLRKEPQNIEGATLLGKVLIGCGRHKEAKDHYTSFSKQFGWTSPERRMFQDAAAAL